MMARFFICTVVSLLLSAMSGFGQTLSSPIAAGTFSSSFSYSNSRNTSSLSDSYHYSGGKPTHTNDACYRFTLNKKMEVTMQHCGSTLSDTYLILLDASGNYIIHNDDWYSSGACSSSTYHSYLKRELDAGTYIVVSEGYSGNGVILTQISGAVIYIQGDNLQDPIVAGTFNSDFQYSNTQNTANYTNTHTARTPNDVFYRFTLGKKMLVTVQHCGSALSDTYLHLLDASGVSMATNDDYSGDGACSSSTFHSFIQKTLEAGTYYVVSEGYGTSGSITTNITGYSSNDFDYPDIPNAYSSDPEAVGSTGGSFDVSATGAATYSIPIAVPQGVNGMQPNLAIVYNSQSGNGIVGWGCNLSGFSAITRGTKTIYYDETAKSLTHQADEAYYLDGQRLIYSSGTVGQEGALYYPESDPFTKVYVHGTYNSSTANTWFEVQHSNGLIYKYGSAVSGRLNYTTSSGEPRIHAWHLDYVEDVFGNYMNYTYSKYLYIMYPAQISYGNNKNESTGLQNTVTFGYEYRSNDSQIAPIDGTVKSNLYQRLKTITTKTGSNIYRSYELQYDVTGDGSATKFSRLNSVTEKNGAGEMLKPTKLNWSYLPAFTQSSQTPTVESTHVPFAIDDNTVPYSDQNYIAADVNGDGLDDLISVFSYTGYTYYHGTIPTNVMCVNYASLNSSGNVQFTTGAYHDIGTSFSMGDWKSQKGGAVPVDFNGDGINEVLIPTTSITEYWKQIGFCFYGNALSGSFEYNLQCSNKMPVYATGDFNNDGKGDVVFIEKGHTSNNYPGEIVGLNSGRSLYRAAINFNLPSKPEKMFVSDYNADGLADILVFYSGGYSIFWNQGYGLSTSTFSNAHKTTGTNIGNVKMIRAGDFNGDGMTDFLMSSTNSSSWYFALNNGNGIFTKQFACTLDVYDQTYTDDQYNSRDDNKFDCQVYDFDFDGKSDVVITKAMYKNDGWDIGIAQNYWISFVKTRTYWMRSTGSSLTQVSFASSNRSDDGLSSRFVSGDFNGDGQVELINYGYNCYNSTNADVSPVWRLYRNPSFNVSKGKVNSVTDGMGSTINITYASLANGGIYTRGTGSTYPVVDYTIPLHAVKTVVSNNGAAGSQTVNYQYNGLKAHLQGKGFLGMSSTTVNNTTLGATIVSGISQWNTTFYVPSKNFTQTTIGGSTAQSEVTLTYADKGSKKYFAYPSIKTETDWDGNTVTTSYQYNTNDGYIMEERTDFGNNMYQKVQYGSYVLAGGTYRPRLITKTQKHSDDGQAFSQKTYTTYNTAKGYPQQVIENYSTQKPLTTNYTYDTFGNVLTSASSGSGVPLITDNYEYDATKRFVTKSYTSPASSIGSCTYDIWGNVLTERDESNSSNILITTHTYDNWGFRTSTVYPDGQRSTFRRGWNNSTSKRYFILTQGTGQPWAKTWYDNKGREVLIETVGAKSQEVKQSLTYNAKGQTTQKKTITGNLTTTENYTYDVRGRIASQNSSVGQSTTYSYGNRSITSTSNGKSVTKTFDAWGGIKTVTDPVSSVTYTYKSLGKPQSATTGGATFSMTYNDAGLQQSLTDPNAGTITYNYDAAGRLIGQTDGRGKTTVNVYDHLGRLQTSNIDGIATSYTYGTAGNNLLHLTKIQTGNNSIEYSYDNFGRKQTETRQVDGEGSFLFTYNYNNKGQLQQITYPGSLQVTRQYDAYGNLQKVLTGSQAIWELTGSTGTITTTQLGNALTSKETHNSKGLLTNLQTLNGSTVLHNMNYKFNGATGNLTSRTGMNKVGESFIYDNLDRLTTVQQGLELDPLVPLDFDRLELAGQDNPAQLPPIEQPILLTSMSINYYPNGNIQSKTGLGEYLYENSPHAVSFVENTGELIPNKEQNISYTAFNKVSSISEQVESDNYLLEIIYGPDQQRWKSSLKKNNALTRTVLYADNYEVVTENGVTRQLYYIGGSNGLVAVYVKQSGLEDKIYYPLTDHLGSIMELVDGNGTEVFRASYDVWGKQTVTNNTFAFHRGYTGHEHLPEFKLINMNGRMYDPILSRFLSPDPLVQAPDWSQSFNRYSYCLNNPLKYTDPSGYVFGVDDAIIILAMMYMGGMQANVAYAVEHDKNPFNPGDWNWKSAHTYIGMAGGAMGGAGMAGYTIPFTQLPGMLSNGALQAGVQVTLNGVGNLTDGRKFFDNWYWAAGMGFASGAYTGYGLAKEKGLNYWWGNKVKYNRTQWSFYNVDKPDYAINFDIPDVGSKADNDCVPTTFAEIESKRGGTRTYDTFANDPNYEAGRGYTASGESYDNLLHNEFGNVETLKTRDYNNLFSHEYMQNAAEKGEIFSVHFGPQNAHADNVRALQVFLRNPSKNRLIFRQSRYNFQRWNNNSIFNIFRIF